MSRLRLGLRLVAAWAVCSCGGIAASPVELPSFALTAQIDSFEGPDVTGAVRPGAVLHFEAAVPHPAGEFPVTTHLYWQLYDATGRVVEGRGAQETAVLPGGTHARRFTLPVAGLPEGRYHLALTHQLASDPSVSRQASVSFELRAPRFALRDFKLNAVPAAELKAPLPAGQPLLVAFTVESDEPLRGIPVDLRVVNAATGALVRDFPLQVSTEARVHALDLSLPPEVLPAGARLRVEVAVRPPQGQPARAAAELTVRPRGIAVRTVPGAIPLGNAAEAGLDIPPGYENPLEISFTAAGEVRLTVNADGVSGMVEGLSRHRAVEGVLRATVKSANGFTSSAETMIRFAPRDGRRVALPFKDEAPLLAALEKQDTPAARAALGAVQLRHAHHFASVHRANGDAGDFLTALGYALAASEMLPQSGAAWRLLGELTLPLVGEPEMLMHAETAFRQLVRLEPADVVARRALYACLLAGRAGDEAVETGAWLLAHDPEFLQAGSLARYNLACMQARRTRSGAVAYREVLARAPDQPAVRLALAVLLRAQGQTDMARAEVTAATASNRITSVQASEAAALLAAWQEPAGELWEDPS